MTAFPSEGLTEAEQLGLELKERGMERAREVFDVQEWKARFIETVTRMAATGRSFTSDDVLLFVGLPRESKTNANNAVGAMMNGLARRGVIRKTTERRPAIRACSHGRELAVWVNAASRSTGGQ